MQPNIRINNNTSGAQYIANGDQNAYTEGFQSVHVLTATKFKVLNGNMIGIANFNAAGSAPLIPAGTMITGRFSEIRLWSGSVLGYYFQP